MQNCDFWQISVQGNTVSKYLEISIKIIWFKQT